MFLRKRAHVQPLHKLINLISVNKTTYIDNADFVWTDEDGYEEAKEEKCSHTVFAMFVIKSRTAVSNAYHFIQLFTKNLKNEKRLIKGYQVNKAKTKENKTKKKKD